MKFFAYQLHSYTIEEKLEIRNEEGKEEVREEVLVFYGPESQSQTLGALISLGFQVTSFNEI